MIRCILATIFLLSYPLVGRDLTYADPEFYLSLPKQKSFFKKSESLMRVALEPLFGFFLPKPINAWMDSGLP